MAASISNADSVPAKKQKLDSEQSKLSDSPPVLQNLEDFVVEKVISENSRSKTITVHGKIGGENAVLLLEKTPFQQSKLDSYLTDKTVLKNTLKNDIYGTYEAYPPPKENAVKAFIIHPATEKHINKYSDQERFVIEETEQLYKHITLPLLEKAQFSLQWVYNILEKKQEADRIVYEDLDPDTGFILLPDMKWDRKDIEALYLVAVVHKHNIRSLRDLNRQSLPLLKNIQEKGLKVIQEKYGIHASKLFVYIHYQPSYYHFHVHFNHVKLESPGFGAERAHLLSDVIQNIEQDSDFYTHRTLTYCVREQDDLYKRFKEAGYFNTQTQVDVGDS